MKDIIVVTGGAGFVGSNLISLLIKKTKFKIISIDDYSTGKKKNHLDNQRVTYVKENTKNISTILVILNKLYFLFFNAVTLYSLNCIIINIIIVINNEK